MTAQDSAGNGGGPDQPGDEATVSPPGSDPPETHPSQPETTTAGWPLDALFPEPAPDVGPAQWREPPQPAPPPAAHRPAYYVSLTVAMMLVLGMIAGLVVLAANPPLSRVTGSPGAPNIPRLPTPTTLPPTSTPPGPTSAPPPAAPPPGGAYTELAMHPLSTATATMPDQTCALPRFDPADSAQASFYQAAKVCADNGFGELLAAAELPAVAVELVTVQDGPERTPCGVVEPAAPAIQCAGTVYMTPAHLRDTEGNDRYPGRYFGVFLREYARGVLDAGGMGPLYEKAPDSDDLNIRAARQATCLAGIASGAMSGRGAVDANITDEIRARLSDLDAPPDAGSWLDRGFASRQLSACNSWAG